MPGGAAAPRISPVRFSSVQPGIDSCGVTFGDRLHHCEVLFQGPVDFSGATFQQNVVFVGCRFDGPVKFSWSKVYGKSYFWNCDFRDDADFTQMQVSPAPGTTPQGDSLYPGESNFSWCRFERAARFYRCRFNGPAWFWRTLFRGVTDFSEARFETQVLFGGRQSKVSVALADFCDPTTYRRLIAAGLLKADPETSDGRYATVQGIETAEQLRRRLAEGFDPPLPAAEVDRVLAMWRERALPMFSGDADVYFRGVTFANAALAQFADVAFRRCLLADSDISRAGLANVGWDSARMFLGKRRRAVYDELMAANREDYERVRRLYRQLRAAYETRAEPEPASDFYYGEMEMRRLSQPPWLRHISLTAWYRYLSGYGENYGLALCWLAFAVFLLFPALYLAAGAASNPATAELHSLEVVTFLKGNTPAGASVATRFVEGFERLAVAVQLGVFLPAIKRKFMR